MDLTGLISSFATGSYTVTRTSRTDAQVQYGKVTPGTKTTLQISAAVAPASGMDLNKLPEGRRSNGAIAVFTTTQLYIGGVGASFEADVIAANGSTWELSHVETWVDPKTGGIAYRCLAVNAS